MKIELKGKNIEWIQQMKIEPIQVCLVKLLNRFMVPITELVLLKKF